MMRQASAWIITAAFVAGFAAPALAQTTAPAQTAPAAPAAPKAPAQAAPAAPKAPAAAEAGKTVAKKVTTKSVTGAVKTASGESLVIVTRGKDKKDVEWTFGLTKDTKITKDKKALEAKGLTDKDSVTVKYTEAADKKTATSVEVKAPKKS